MATPPPEVADPLRIPAGEPALVRRRVMLLDDKPVELTDSWYPAAIASGTPLAEHRKIRGGAVTLLASLGYTAAAALEEIQFRPATDTESAALNRPAGEHVIILTRIVLTEDGTPFEVTVMTMVPEGRRLRYRLAVD